MSPCLWFRARIVLPLAVAVSIGVSQFLEATIPTGDSPTDVLWNPVSNKVYVANSQSDNVTIINGATNQVIATVDVQEYPSGFAWNSVMNKVYCVSGDNERVTVIDGAGDTVIKTFRTAARASGIAFNSALNKLYIACNEDPVYRVAVIDAGPDTVLRYIPAPRVGALLWSAATNRVFSCGADTIRVIDCETDEVVVRMQGGGWIWCYNPVNAFVYIAASHDTYVLTPGGDSIVAVVRGWAYDLAAVPFTNKIYASGNASGIQVIGGASNLVVDTIPVVAGSMVCDLVKAKVYCSNQNAQKVDVIDARADTLIKTIPLGRSPEQLCWNQTNSRVYITDFMDDVVYVIRDTSTGIAEAGPAAGQARKRTATILAGRTLRHDGPGSERLLNAGGQVVMEVNPGDNNVSGLPAGVYVLADRQGRLSARVVKVP
jgi:YVTN family beta-propeller protein